MANIPFIDLKKQFQIMEKDIRAALDAVLAHGQFIMGPEVAKLESELAARVGVAHCIGCASGTDALLLPMMARGLGPGDAVFTTPFTFIATAEVISLLRARPVLVDVDPTTFNLDADKLREAVEQVQAEGLYRPTMVIPVDLFGLPADYDRIMALAREKGLLVIEDAAQSFGASAHGRPAGGLAHVGATSFFPAKPLGCYGDGGAVFTNDDEMAATMRSIRVHGQGRDKYENVRIGLNGRLDTLQAAVLLAKLPAFSGEIAARQRVAARYTQRLAGVVTTPAIPEGYVSAWAQYSVLTEHRNEVMAKLKAVGVPTAVYYPLPLHRQEAFRYLGYHPGDFPVAESLAERIFSLPMHPYLEDAQIDEIARQVRLAVSSGV